MGRGAIMSFLTLGPSIIWQVRAFTSGGLITIHNVTLISTFPVKRKYKLRFMDQSCPYQNLMIFDCQRYGTRRSILLKSTIPRTFPLTYES
ncbi:hypothetical protein C8Q79DRAFT_740179 [Trametes meyenii]|nr:hypothetical protein C8Q79DRAFT_740179 [Trametes meyenii]